MSQLIGQLAGAPQAASQNQQYYTNAMNSEINAAGSPAATDFLRLQDAALRPQFAAADQQVGSTEAAQGIAGSGAGRNIGGGVAANQASTLAGAAAPLYQSALNSYSGINAAAPQGDEQAYNSAIQQFYQALSGAGQAAAGIPPNFGAGPTDNPLGSPMTPQDPNSDTYVPGFDTSNDNPYATSGT